MGAAGRPAGADDLGAEALAAAAAAAAASRARPAHEDPTRALDDFVRRMRPVSQPQAAELPDLGDLRARLQPGRAVPPAPKGGRLRNGQVWQADEVEDVPVVEVPRAPPAPSTLPQVDLPAVEPPADTTPGEFDSTLEGAARFAALQQDADEEAARTPVWQPDPQTLKLKPQRHPRHLDHWAPGAWIGAVRLVLQAHTEVQRGPQGPVVDSHEPMRLLLLWPPAAGDRPHTGRWPQRVQLVAVEAELAAQTLLAQLDDDARLWLNPQHEDIDWALAAEIALHHEPRLLPWQIDGLRAFVQAERDAVFARLNQGYTQAAPGAAILRKSPEPN